MADKMATREAYGKALAEFIARSEKLLISE